MDSTLSYIEVLARETKKPQEEVMTLAFRVGVRQLWREHVLGRYLRKQMSRDAAIEAAGIDWVELAEKQRNAMQEDIAWALGE